jgi:hypothetical protein
MTATVEFAGERFGIADRVGLMAMMRFAKVAKSGVDSNELDGLAAMYDLLEQCIADDEWERFQAHADKVRADGDELMTVVNNVFGVLSERPTRRPSDSSAGPSTTKANSTGDSSSRVIARLEEQGRPDLALVVSRAQAARAS